MRKRVQLIKLASIIVVALFVSELILFFLPTPPLLQGLSFSKAVYSRQHQLLRLTLSADGKYRLFTPLSQISQQFIEATLLQEDRYFRRHIGINPFSMIKALWQTYVLHSRRVGASTISMQVARLRYGIYSKSISGKLLQMAKALQLELHYSKDDILEAYLNLAPYGGNVEGVGAASLIYYNQRARRLSLAQTLTLSIIPQNPCKRTANNSQLKTIRDHALSRWLKYHPEDVNKKGLFALPLSMQHPQNLAFHAPHLVNTLLNDRANTKHTLLSSLDSQAQTLVERITRQYIERKKVLGVNNAAVLLVDTRDMSVRAFMGSADFFNQNIAGQINGVETKRSPGSTLKPFIYGLALDQGLIHPNTVLSDVPYSFNGYNPENFDYEFMGPIKARDALILSRNIPAIFLANQLRQPTLHQLLEKAQVTHLKSESFYGLALNLGAAELTLRELVGLYAMLVNEGLWYPVHFFKNELKPKGIRLLSPEASFLVLDMLKNTAPVEGRSDTRIDLPVAWKTGTSSGYRDAWTVGSFGPYVLGVWIGNFDNRSNPAFIGKTIAAPLFFELISAIKQELGPLAQLMQDPYHLNLKKVQVCKASGNLPTRFCPEREWTWFIPGKSPIKTDTLYREVAINDKTGLRTCHIDEHTRFKVFEFWPSDLLAIFKKAGIQKHTPPFFEADCALASNDGMSPKISSPQKNLTYLLQIDKQHNTIPFTAVTDAGIKFLYWFVNGAFIGKTTIDKAYLWHATLGHYVVRVVDDHGLADARDLMVKSAVN